MKQIKLTQNKFALVDDDDFNKVNSLRWHIQNNKYPATRVLRGGKKVKILMHRLVMKNPKSLSVDHINHNTFDNRKFNLRICSHSENMKNLKPRKLDKKTSRFKGVSWDEGRQKWFSCINLNYKTIFLGRFPREQEKIAAIIYDRSALKHFGQFAKLNFPEVIYA